jgi:hypothetical protein
LAFLILKLLFNYLGIKELEEFIVLVLEIEKKEKTQVVI